LALQSAAPAAISSTPEMPLPLQSRLSNTSPVRVIWIWVYRTGPLVIQPLPMPTSSGPGDAASNETERLSV
jgi:hypothetical protein